MGSRYAAIYTRKREHEIPSKGWVSELGKFRKPESKRLSTRDAALTEMNRVLARLRQSDGQGQDSG